MAVMMLEAKSPEEPLDDGLARIDARFDKIEWQFDRLEERFDAVHRTLHTWGVAIIAP